MRYLRALKVASAAYAGPGSLFLINNEQHPNPFRLCVRVLIATTQVNEDAGRGRPQRKLSSFRPANKAELQTAVDAYCSDSGAATATYGAIESWDTSLITDMSSLVIYKDSCNPPLGSWDTSAVTDMG